MGSICCKKGNKVHAGDEGGAAAGDGTSSDWTRSGGRLGLELNGPKPDNNGQPGTTPGTNSGSAASANAGTNSDGLGPATGPLIAGLPTRPSPDGGASHDPAPKPPDSTTPGFSVSPTDYRGNHSGVATSTVEVPSPPPLPSPSTPSKEEQDVLKVTTVDLKVKENTSAHHTDQYEITQERSDETGAKLPPSLVLRRGQPFDIQIKFHRKIDVDRDEIITVFDIGSGGKEGLGTRVSLSLWEKFGAGEWGIKTLDLQDDNLLLRIYTPHTLAVAKWNLKFDISFKNITDESKVFRYTHPEPIYILFNPWCKDDAVYMSDEASRTEYVLNDKGRIYCGTTDQISSRPWNFGQFEDFMLDVCLYLLDTSCLAWRLRGNPIHVSRKISALANSPDDSGILVGNWSGKYDDGTPPFKWFGSVSIMEEYSKSHTPVKYGQCWVFSGIVTSICRCIGLPARSVTNFSSAHDCDGSITIDSYWTKDGKPMEEYNSDSVWNFHVWNDVWMTRPDLPDGFGGWQAIDATPQETSEGIYCAGPASVEALKHGLVQYPYDGPFIFAEVNADKVNWIEKEEGGWTHTMEHNKVGKNISTFCAKTQLRLDITDLYKFSEGTEQERTAVWRAASDCSTKKGLYTAEAQDMVFKLTEKNDAIVGEDFDVTISVLNYSTEERSVYVTLTATVVNYTGVPLDVIKSESFTVKVKPKKEETTKMTVRVREYLGKAVDMCHIKISSMCRVEQTKQFHCQSDDFRLLKPRIAVEVPANVKVGQEFTVVAHFINPLPITLTDCEFQVEAALLQKPFQIKHGKVNSHLEARMTTKLTAERAGDKEVIVSFGSKELWALSGVATVKVTE